MFQPARRVRAFLRRSRARAWGAKQMIKEGVLADPRPGRRVRIAHGVRPAGRPHRLSPGRRGWRARMSCASSDGTAGPRRLSVAHVDRSRRGADRARRADDRQPPHRPDEIADRAQHFDHQWRLALQHRARDSRDDRTIRTYDAEVRKACIAISSKSPRTFAASADAKAEVEIIELYDPLVNHARMAARMAPVLERAADGNIQVMNPSGARGGLSFFLTSARAVLQCRRGAARTDLARPRPNHSPNFMLDESSLVGRRARARIGDGELSASAKTD